MGFWSDVGDAISGFFEAVGDALTSIAEGIGNVISGIANGIGDLVSDVADGFSNLFESVASSISSGFNVFGNWIFNNIIDPVGGILSGIFQGSRQAHALSLDDQALAALLRNV